MNHELGHAQPQKWMVIVPLSFLQEQLCAVGMPHQGHWYSPGLDVDLESILHPENYPLVAKVAHPERPENTRERV